MSVVDAHVHLYPPEIVRDAERIAQREPYFRLLSGGRTHRFGSAEQLVERMEREGIDEAWAFGFAFRDAGLCRLCNDYVGEAARRHPNRIHPLAVVPPLGAEAEAEISRRAGEGFIGVGELFPDGQGFDLDDRRQTRLIAGPVHEAGLFLLIHAADPVGHDYPGRGTAGPVQAAAFCLNHPEVRVVWAHFGGGLWAYETMPEMRLALRNARYDCAAAPFLHEERIFPALEAIAPGKLLLGTDWPLLGRERYDGLLERSGLSPEKIRGIRGDNARAFASMSEIREA
jgi:hypothetical protein